jgi:hypothetical protein
LTYDGNAEKAEDGGKKGGELGRVGNEIVKRREEMNKTMGVGGEMVNQTNL